MLPELDPKGNELKMVTLHDRSAMLSLYIMALSDLKLI